MRPTSTPGHPTNAGPSSLQIRRQKAVQEARKHLAKGDAPAATKCLLPLEKKSRHDAEFLAVLGLCYATARAARKGLDCATRSFKLRPHPQPLITSVECLRMDGETDRAVAICDQLIEEFPQAALDAKMMKAGALEESGQFEEARRVVEPLLHDDIPDKKLKQAQYEWAKLLVQGKEYEAANLLLDELTGDPSLIQQKKRAYLHLKAKSCDRQKDYAQAFEAATAANEIEKLEFDPDLYDEQVSVLIENWSVENMAKFPHAACTSELPIFIAGMPRSGTSLIDQIIDAHPRAAGVGELSDIETFATRLSHEYDADKEPPHCFGQFDQRAFTRIAAHYVQHIKKLSPPGTERVVNKALGNNKLVGLFALLFPRTRIIHAMRDPRDVSISCYMGGFNNRLHAWTTQIDWASGAWAQSERMMQHWKDVLDVPILDVHYEALVADPENQFRRIIDFIGLPWDDACMEFHKSRRTVRTLSYDQVNRPIYKSSAGRHVNYAPFIEGIEFPEYVVPGVEMT